jgi:hypothetical protein
MKYEQRIVTKAASEIEIPDAARHVIDAPSSWLSLEPTCPHTGLSVSPGKVKVSLPVDEYNSSH